jgi:hypothetical protein
MNRRERERMRRLERAAEIAADMFASEGYLGPTGDGGPASIKRFLLRKAREELRTLDKKSPDASESARVRTGEAENRRSASPS